MTRRKVLILGAAGRDFHNFNVHYRDDAASEVVAFTATQIPEIANRRYPPLLAGSLYPAGIAIVPEDAFDEIVRREDVDDVVFAYSDLSHEDVMHKASRALAAGASFTLLGPRDTMIDATKPVISIGAVRTGAGKSPVARFVASHLTGRGFRVAVLRHPMPYGDLERQAVQRFATLAALDDAAATIEEREEYEPHLRAGAIVYAGVDYQRILRIAEEECDIIVWDGGNNDLPFVRPDLHVVLVDPHRAGHELRYHPGEANLRMADVVIVSKVGTAESKAIAQVKDNARSLNPSARLLEGDLEITIPGEIDLNGRDVIVVEDGPTMTHGGMSVGAGLIAARRAHARVVDPRPWAVGSIARAFEEYPHLKEVVPALGYGPRQLDELRETLDAAPCDIVMAATPVDLQRATGTRKHVIAVRYEYRDLGGGLTAALRDLEERVMT